MKSSLPKAEFKHPHYWQIFSTFEKKFIYCMFSSSIANICTLNQQGYFSINNDKVKRILCFCLNKLLLKKKKKKKKGWWRHCFFHLYVSSESLTWPHLHWSKQAWPVTQTHFSKKTTFCRDGKALGQYSQWVNQQQGYLGALWQTEFLSLGQT